MEIKQQSEINYINKDIKLNNSIENIYGVNLSNEFKTEDFESSLFFNNEKNNKNLDNILSNNNNVKNNNYIQNTKYNKSNFDKEK